MSVPHSQCAVWAFCESINCHGADIVVLEHGPVTLLAVTGEVDAANARHFDAGLRRFTDTASPVVLDLSGIGFLGVQGVRGLLHFDDECRRSGQSWVLVAGTMVRRLVGIAGRGKALRTAGSVSEAVRELGLPVPPTGPQSATGGRIPD